ncbi:MAG: protein NO VEIN domain-containing protein [Candidatus Dormibacteria bacterium]
MYYRGRRRSDGTDRPQVYLGVGIVGPVRKSPLNPDRWLCDIEDWRPFAEPLRFKDSVGGYYEPGGAQGGLYWRQGVQLISESTFLRILRDADACPPFASPDPTKEASAHESDACYGSADLVAAVDQYAIEAAQVVIRQRWPGSQVVVQPHNNPGYDILLGTLDSPERFVEVKGTTLPLPHFFLSEGERQFSRAHASTYTILVIYAIDLQSQAHKVFRWDGAIAADQFELTARQWLCEPRELTA